MCCGVSSLLWWSVKGELWEVVRMGKKVELGVGFIYPSFLSRLSGRP